MKPKTKLFYSGYTARGILWRTNPYNYPKRNGGDFVLISSVFSMNSTMTTHTQNTRAHIHGSHEANSIWERNFRYYSLQLEHGTILYEKNVTFTAQMQKMQRKINISILERYRDSCTQSTLSKFIFNIGTLCIQGWWTTRP